jgi:uncharacterized protein (TIGR03067 family)
MRRFLPLLVLLSLAFAPAPLPKPDRRAGCADLKAMQGTWYRTSVIANGIEHERTPGGTKIVITDTHLQFPSPLDAWTITLDAKKSPKHFDYVGNSHYTNDTIFRGIYRLEGDTLILCCNKGPRVEDRPTKFESSKDSVWIQVFKRKQP